jgi:hypothetical protein
MARKKTVNKDDRTPWGERVPQLGAGLPPGYAELLEDLKGRVRTAQLKAAVAVNREMIQLYWDFGRLIVERQEREGWGKGIVDRLAKDIQKAFPGLAGFSPSNVWRMRSFYLAYTKEVTILAQSVRELDGQNMPQPVAEIPWGHNVRLRSRAACARFGRPERKRRREKADVSQIIRISEFVLFDMHPHLRSALCEKRLFLPL